MVERMPVREHGLGQCIDTTPRGENFVRFRETDYLLRRDRCFADQFVAAPVHVAVMPANLYMQLTHLEPLFLARFAQTGLHFGCRERRFDRVLEAAHDFIADRFQRFTVETRGDIGQQLDTRGHVRARDRVAELFVQARAAGNIRKQHCKFV